MLTARKAGGLLAALSLLVLAAVRPAAAQFITVGTAGSDNAFPFGVSSSLPLYAAGGEYQEIYTSSAFSGTTTLTNVAFASSTHDQPGTATYDVTLGLSSTAASVSAPSTDFAANKGANFTTVFSGTLTASLLDNGTFDLVFPFSTPFTYDPSQGNLLLDVIINSPTTGSGFNTFITNDLTFPTPQVTSRVFQSFGTGPAFTDQFSLYTRFGAAPASTVPEPSSTAAMGLGVLGLLGLACRARRRNRRLSV